MPPRKPRQTDNSDTSNPDNNDAPSDELAELKAQMAELQGRLSSTESALTQERTGRQQAEQRSMSSAERALRAELATADTTLTSMETESSAIEDQIASLSDEPGHGREIAQLTRKLTVLSARTETETARKSWLTGEIDKAKIATTERAAPVMSSDVLANGRKLSDFDQPTQDWFRAHPRVMTDVAYLDKVIGAATYAINNKGLKANTTEYFKFIEGDVGAAPVAERQTPDADELDEGEDLVPEVPNADSPYSRPTQRVSKDGDLDYRVEKPQVRAAGPGAIAAATPPSRSVPSGAGGRQNPRQPLLTSEEREVADGLFGHVKNPADRYIKYADSKKFMADRKSSNAGVN